MSSSKTTTAPPIQEYVVAGTELRPLPRPLVLWYHDRQTKDWSTSLKPVAGCKTVQSYWRVANHLAKPSDMPPGKGDLLWFVEGVRPEWESPANARGGRIMLRVRRDTLTQWAWSRISLAFVSGRLDRMGPVRKDAPGEAGDPGRKEFKPADPKRAADSRDPANRDQARTRAGLAAARSSRTPLVLGVALCPRSTEDHIALWVSDAGDSEGVAGVRDLLCSLVQAPSSASIDWRPHSKRMPSGEPWPKLPPRADDAAFAAQFAPRPAHSKGPVASGPKHGARPEGAGHAVTARGPPERGAGAGGMGAGFRRGGSAPSGGGASGYSGAGVDSSGGKAKGFSGGGKYRPAAAGSAASAGTSQGAGAGAGDGATGGSGSAPSSFYRHGQGQARQWGKGGQRGGQRGGGTGLSWRERAAYKAEEKARAGVESGGGGSGPFGAPSSSSSGAPSQGGAAGASTSGIARGFGAPRGYSAGAGASGGQGQGGTRGAAMRAKGGYGAGRAAGGAKGRGSGGVGDEDGWKSAGGGRGRGK